MAFVHNTTLRPSKLELLARWLPTRPWYTGTAEPALARAGGFRLDDPDGEVGIELLVVTDTSGGEPVAYLVPMTYRGALLPGADDALIGTSQHGVLGMRWFYDAPHDPVFVAQAVALAAGTAVAQDQHLSDTADPSVLVSPLGIGCAADDPVTVSERERDTVVGIGGGQLIVHRILTAATGPVAGQVWASWGGPDGGTRTGPFVQVRAGTP
jgi:hypothetical protein